MPKYFVPSAYFYWKRQQRRRNTDFYVASANDLFDRLDSPPTPTRKILINNLIGSLEFAGVWQKLDAFYMLAAADAQTATRNWVADQYNLSPQNAPTFTADRGYAGNGTTSYLDTNFNPVTSAGKYATSNAHLSAWSRSDRASNGISLMGLRNNAQTSFIALVQFAGGVGRFRITSVAGSGITSPSSLGWFLGTRANNSVVTGYRNGESLGTENISETTLANLSANIFIGAENRIGAAIVGASTDQIAQASIGANLSATEAAAMYAAINTYLQAVGAA